MHADVIIDGLAAETDYCVEVHEFGNLRCQSVARRQAITGRTSWAADASVRALTPVRL